MAAEVTRRTALLAAGAATATGPLSSVPAAAVDRGAGEAGVLFFEPGSPRARALAAAAIGQRLVAVAGDPVRLGREQLADHHGPVGGITRWSDYLLLGGLAEERGYRLVAEERLAAGPGPLIVRWTMR